MSDIVERLRSMEVFICNGVEGSLVANEAAAEITRLRAELEDTNRALKLAGETLSSATEALVQSRALLKEAGEVIGPLVKEAQAWSVPIGLDRIIWEDNDPVVEHFPHYEGELTVGDLRRAAAFMEKLGGENANS